jgi:hypothetical protein
VKGERGMRKVQIISSVLGLLVVLPIWYYLLFQILVRVNASELMFFLYWVYLPAGIIAGVLARIAGK